MANSLHSKISASTCERWWNCPGSVREAAKCPPQPESAYAKDGTCAHKLAELCLKEGHGPFHMAGQELEGVCVTNDMCEAVKVYLDVIDDDLIQYGLSRKDLQVERKFHLKEIHPDAYGTNDANLPVFLTKVIVYDFKYGSGIAVDAEDNKQGLYYALGASLEGDYEEFEIVIVQPRAMHKKGPIRRWCIKRAELDTFAKELKACAEATFKPDAPLHCGPWCKKTFCQALIQCPEARKDMQDAALMAFDAPVKTVMPTKPENLTPLQLKKLLDMAPIIGTYLKSVEDYALDYANKGNKVEGYKLVARRSNRKWVDEEVVKKKFGKTATRTVVETLSPSQLETELKKSMTGKEAKGAVEPLTFKPDTGNVLVPDDDAREPVRPKLEQTFGDESLFG